MSLSTLVQTIETDVATIVKKAEAEGESWFKGFAPVLEADATAAWTQFKPTIMGLIAGVEQMALTTLASGQSISLNKLEVATTGLIAAAATQGVTIAKATAATVIQQAVTSLGNVVTPSK